MKIAYLMLVHQNPQLLKRAIGKISTDGCAFFIHVDRKTDIKDFSAIGGANVFFCDQRLPVYWGEFSLVQATLQLIRDALKRSENFDYFVLLSGSDYPLRSGKYLQRFLEDHSGSEFMNLVRMPAPGFPLTKINTLRYPTDMPVRRFATRALSKLGLGRRNFQKSFKGLEPYSGSQWWALSRDAVQYLLEYARLNPQVEKYFRNAFTSDEMFFHTILGNSLYRPRMRRNFVYIDWPKPSQHPALLGEAHLQLFKAKKQVWVEDQFGSGEALFARKFSDDKLDLIDQIDEMIAQKDG
jgi:hypothetical protein